MSDVIRIEGQYYIRSTSSMADSRTLVLKHGETFAVFDRHGDVQPVGYGEQGVFHEGTRFLSGLVLTIDGQRPLLLSSTVRRNNSMLAVDLTNPDLRDGDRVTVPQDSLHILRSKFLWQGVCYERVTITNFTTETASFRIVLTVDADFADIFEVRGQRRPRRGELNDPIVDHRGISIVYRGLDMVERVTRVTSTPPPDEIDEYQMCFDLTLAPGGQQNIDMAVACEIGALRTQLTFNDARDAADQLLLRERAGCVEIFTSNDQFNNWINQSMEDLHMLTTETPAGLYPYAGIPWFSTPFGRDGIITALQTLWIKPEIARGVLNYLAQTQATAIDPAADAEPGKILHETRGGEMAALGEIPFGMYYGSVDSTPLFIILAGRYYAATADQELIAWIWPNIEAALAWIDNYADLDGDGFFEYQRRDEAGLLQQGWKDSHDSIFHADGTPAELPIALCEMQGYVFAAWRAAARLADVLGHFSRATELRRRAEKLRQAFEDHFWDEELGTYVIALDGNKQPCRVVSSNAGHALFAGIASEERAARVAETLLDESSFSGWGIRTIAASTSRYNPMSYHNGSIWPHDNALIADGLSRYGHQDKAAVVMQSMFDASIFMENHRMPELFCGFPRRPGEGPTLYPVACSPQAWAAGAVFMLLRACLGLSANAPAQQLRFIKPLLPPYLDEVRVSNLRVGDSCIDVLFHRYPDDVGISVMRRSGAIEVVAVK